MTTPAPHKLRVALVGGGIGGLCLARGLLSRAPQLDVHVYESVPAYTDIGAGLALHKNAIGAMTLIDPAIRNAYMAAALSMASEATQDICTRVELAAGPHAGALVAELGRAPGRKTIARSDLLAALRGLIPEDRLHFGKRLSEIDDSSDGTKLHFKDGTSVGADLLIGSDGVHSLARAHVLGHGHAAIPAKNHDGWQIYRTLVPAETARKVIADKFTKDVFILCGPKGHINCMPLHQGRDLSAGVAVRGALFKPGVTAENRPELNVADFAEYTPEARAIVELVARDTSASWALTEHDPAESYIRRNVCLMGDAAHAALPFAGNGAAQAIEDACVLVALLSDVKERDQIPAALHAYDAVRRPRADEVTLMARAFGQRYAFVHGDSPGEMRAFFGKSAKFTNDVDLAGQNEEALRIFHALLAENKNCGPGDGLSDEGTLTEESYAVLPAAVAA